MDSYDIIENAVREYWKQTGSPHEVVAFFYQKYENESEDKWEYLQELVWERYDEVYFLNDFCEGQTCVKDIKIVSLDEVLECYGEVLRSNKQNKHDLNISNPMKLICEMIEKIEYLSGKETELTQRARDYFNNKINHGWVPLWLKDPDDNDRQKYEINSKEEQILLTDGSTFVTAIPTRTFRGNESDM